MSHDIIDNRTRELAPEIRNLLADSTRAHFAVGYFFLSGFQAIAAQIPHLEQLRLLIGNVTDRQTIEQLAEGTHHLETIQHTVRRQRMAGAQADRIRAETAASIQATLELMDQTDEAQELALSLANLIAQGQVQVRVYTRGRLHAKAYLFDFDPARIHAQKGAAIVGSSNLSLGGVTHNTELNVRVFGDANHAELSRWFNELWAEAEDFRADLMQELQRAFQGALDRGLVPAGETATDILYKSDLDDELAIYEALEQASGRYPSADFDVPRLQAALAADIALLDEMARLVEPIGPDADDKLQQLVAMLTRGCLTDGRRLPGDLAHGKVLVFTQYADTAHYLYDNLRHLGRIRAVESDTSDLGRVILRFAPKANQHRLESGEEELRILVATDVLSEGLNLQDANHIVNYDLHWNPIRLIQRVGRVDRIGTAHSTVYAYNFLPETGLERELGLEQRLERRIAEIHRTIGEDAEVLHKGEPINREAMYAIYRGDASVLDDEPEADIFNLLEAEELIRQLQRTDPDRFQEIATMPDGIRSARRAAGAPGLFVFCQAGNYQRLYLVDEAGHRTADPQPAIRAIRCEPDEPTLALPADLNARVAAVKRDFDAEVRAREAEIRHAVGKALGRDYALAELRLVFEATEDADEKARLALLSEILTAVPLTARAHRELNTLRQSRITGRTLVAQLLRIVRDYNLEEAYRALADQAPAAPLIPRIVCSEALL